MRGIDCSTRLKRQFITAALVVSLVLSQGCDQIFDSQAQDLQVSDSDSTSANSSKKSPQSQDCLAIGDFGEKEKCIASSDDFKECPDSDLRCAPYRNMYIEERRLEKTNAELMAIAVKQYATHTTNDHAYLDDLARYFNESDRAWRTYRDAQCAMEPFVQGMSRRESADITEVCRLDETRKRISALNELELPLKENGAAP